MDLYLTLFTHLCVHLLGLMGNSVLTGILFFVALLAYWIHIVLIPVVWPARILHDTLTRIEAMRTRLHDEAGRRRTLNMSNLSTYGLRELSVLEDDVKAALADHRAHLETPLSYARAASSFCKRARRCRRDVEVLCEKLAAKIQRFDNGSQVLNSYQVDGEEAAPSNTPQVGEEAAPSVSWLDAFLAALSDQG
ncbi:hypothetical protein DFH09DRAFT_1088233 [Mycena vulgaris]|nr:hypothetical protein DFH09DRAFT_1088233 [Mycena vulgaris]